MTPPSLWQWHLSVLNFDYLFATFVMHACPSVCGSIVFNVGYHGLDGIYIAFSGQTQLVCGVLCAF